MILADHARRRDPADLPGLVFGKPQRAIWTRHQDDGFALGVVVGYSTTAPAVVIRPIWLAAASANHSAPSGPAAMKAGSAPAVGIGYSVTTPAVVIRPIWLAENSVNHSAPSGPAVMPTGAAFPVGTADTVTTPAVVIRPIRLSLGSVNHSAPSGPAAMPHKFEPGEKGYSVMLTLCAGASAPALSNQTTSQRMSYCKCPYRCAFA